MRTHLREPCPSFVLLVLAHYFLLYFSNHCCSLYCFFHLFHLQTTLVLCVSLYFYYYNTGTAATQVLKPSLYVYILHLFPALYRPFLLCNISPILWWVSLNGKSCILWTFAYAFPWLLFLSLVLSLLFFYYLGAFSTQVVALSDITRLSVAYLA